MVAIDDDAVCFVVELVPEEGEAMRREWTWGQVASGDYPRWPWRGPPSWLREATAFRDDPFLPHVFNALVPAGQEDRARDLLFGDVLD